MPSRSPVAVIHQAQAGIRRSALRRQLQAVAAGKSTALSIDLDQSGADVGEVEMPAKQTGSPMSYQIDGKQFIVLAVSGNDGAELIAYTLP